MSIISAALTLTVALSTSGDGRVLLCRPRIAGDAALARGDALLYAAKARGGFLDYGVACDDPAESARAARRAGFENAVFASAEGRLDGSLYLLVLTDAASEEERGRRKVEVAPGADAARPLSAALGELLGTLPSRPSGSRLGAYATLGAGALSLAAGAALAYRARDAASRANGATNPAEYTSARAEWRGQRAASGVLLGLGAAASALGITWRVAF